MLHFLGLAGVHLKFILCYTEQAISKHIVRQLVGNKKALSLGMAFFLVLGALLGNTFVRKSHAFTDKGILGGPVSSSDPGQPEEASLAGNGSVVIEDLPYVPTPEEAALPSDQELPQPVKDTPAPKVSSAKTPAPRAGDASEPAKKTVSRYFIQPASGLNWGILHNHNAVDIANDCGTPIRAAADGTVVADPSLGDGSGGWNGGYGKFVLIQHPNATKTRYAHMQKIFVSPGDHVTQGETIGTIGNTGEVKGTTGCHVHFEVYGAPNPFARR